MSTPLIFLVVMFGIAVPIALLLGRKMSGDAVATSRAFLASGQQQFDASRRPGEIDPIWVMVSGTFHGALGVTDQRLLIHTGHALESVERRDVTGFTATKKNYGGAGHLWGHEITIALRDRSHVLGVIDQADYLPPEHDLAGLLTRMES
jgi:hypothetical protein